jgi:REP element-mobilizing transposase RayT
MARGDRREPIVKDDADRDAFVELLAELVERTGFEFFSWVLMGNHYHLVFKTPEPNLVEGMKWLQNTWTKRFNARHRLSGHLFGDRYKAVLVEEGEHLGTLIDYVHLNPFRAGLVEVEDGLESYRWSSLTDYMVPPRKRSGWVEVARGLAHKEFPNDSAVQRGRYMEHLEAVAKERGGVPELPEGEERTLQSTLRRGWYFGAEGFREKLVKRLEKLKEKDGKAHHRRSGYTGAQARDHGQSEAKRIIRSGLSLAGLKRSELAALKKGDWRKRVIGRMVRKSTVMPVGWIAEALRMGDPKHGRSKTGRQVGANRS